MESLSQALLGATTFALIQDKNIGKKALVVGAIAGTIPDLDVLLAPFFNEVAFITVHRSISHSIIFAILASFGFGWIAHKITKYQYKYRDWTLAFFLAIFTHSLLDWCTTYGTKMLSPFSGHLFSLNNIHVIEPIYTSILLIGVVWLSIKTASTIKRTQVIRWTLAFSTLYLGWTFVSKGIANHQFMQAIQAQHIEYEKMIITPTPLNTLLWQGTIKTKNGYYVGTYSLLDSRKNIELQFIASHNELIPQIQQFRKGWQYLDYTQDFPLIEMEGDSVRIYAIKFGSMTYFGKPAFINPLCLNLKDKDDANFKIDHSSKIKGPVNDYKELFNRVKGI